jgi:hypothetical protein
MTMRTAIVSGLALAMLGYPAAASTAGAWNQHHIQVRAACIAASDLVEAKALDYTAFDDSIGYDVVSLEGKFKSGGAGREVCLFSRAAQKAIVSETTVPYPAPPPGSDAGSP